MISRNRFIIRVSSEGIASFLAALLIYNVFIDYVVSGTLRVLRISSDVVSIRSISYGIYVLSALIVLLYNKRVSVKSVLLPLALIVTLIVSLNVNPGISFYSTFYEALIYLCIPVYLVYGNVRSFDNIFKNIVRLAYVSGVFFCFIFSIHYFVTPIINSASYQTTSYAFLLPLFILMQKENKKPRDIVLLAIMLFFSIVAGGRISLFCIAIFIAVQLIKKGKRNVLYGIYTLLVAVLTVIFFDEILNLIVYVSGKFGIVGGIAYYSKVGNVFLETTRTDIWEQAFTLISKKPIFGYGLLGDRLVFSPGIAYAHNVFLEIALQFGLIVMSLFSIWFFSRFINILHNKRNDIPFITTYRSLLFSTGFLVLLLSCSYLNQPSFFAFLGMMLAVKNNDSNRLTKNDKERGALGELYW